MTVTGLEIARASRLAQVSMAAAVREKVTTGMVITGLPRVITDRDFSLQGNAAPIQVRLEGAQRDWAQLS